MAKRNTQRGAKSQPEDSAPQQVTDQKPEDSAPPTAEAPASKPRPKPAKDGTVKVRLLAGRTGIGHAGEVVDYPAEDAERHSLPPFETVEIL